MIRGLQFQNGRLYQVSDISHTPSTIGSEHAMLFASVMIPVPIHSELDLQKWVKFFNTQLHKDRGGVLYTW